jgi:transcription-repair coupling factor (superfamily II helicase)
VSVAKRRAEQAEREPLAKDAKNAEKSVEEFAVRMLSVAAERQTVKAYSHPPDTKWQVEFEESFLYRETPDQLRSAEEIKRDMEAEKPMDRLLCADVGFGKTEVAIRAAFKAVMGGRQVAILVPTTVLARQHLENIRQRMSEFPVTVEMLCRLTPKNREREIIKGISEGTVDIVVGTHRVISKDVRFKNLGLVVIDEEQRFGVKHKERFKDLFRLVDVLTLSATPIPRTLYLALMGMRDMSTIETPPPNKQAVMTQICPYDERVIKQAVDAEIERGGQVFFLHNRVMTIEKVAQRIRDLCPKARVIIGHGQMDSELLEDVMHTFVDGGADVLVCTTIIESGVDIPNANTIIIDRADRFGLADLYQLARSRGTRRRAGACVSAAAARCRHRWRRAQARERHQAIRRPRQRLQNRAARPGDPRRGQPARHGAERPHRRHRLRFVLPDAGCDAAGGLPGHQRGADGRRDNPAHQHTHANLWPLTAEDRTK